MRGANLKEMVKTHGAEKVSSIIEEMLALPETDPNRLKPENFSIRELWEALVGSVYETLDFAAGNGRSGYHETAIREAPLDSTAFPTITGTLINAKVIEGYDIPAAIGESLTTMIPSNKRDETFAGFDEPENVEEVKEGGEYQESTLMERYVTGSSTKMGRIISLTEEMIMFDRTGQILTRAQRLGKRARLGKEKTIIDAVTEVVQAYKPLGVATSMYTAAGYTLRAGNPLIDWTDIDNAEQYLAEQADTQNSDPIDISGANVLLVPTALKATALQIVSATEVEYQNPVLAAPADFATRRSKNPVAGYVALSSPLVHQRQVNIGSVATATAASNWWFGDFKEAFGWLQIWDLQTMRMSGQGTAVGFTRDIIENYKVRYFGGCIALSNKHVVKSTA